MNAFDKVIGYDSIKKELLEICDTIKNRENYVRMGATTPHGLLISGRPGLGKSLMAKCFVEESGAKGFVISKGGQDGKVSYIRSVFEKAAENTPAVIVIDDIDKYVEDEEEPTNSRQLNEIQECIDWAADKDIFVIATANNTRCLPESLKRSRRFDRKIKVRYPLHDDAEKLIKMQLEAVNVADDVNANDIVCMMENYSCADMVAVINNAAAHTVYNKRDKVSMEDITRAVLQLQYNCPDDSVCCSEEQIAMTAFHEAGHVVLSELILPGSVGMATVKTTGRDGLCGFVHPCKHINNPEDIASVSLAGKAAVELFFPVEYDAGCGTDIGNAYREIFGQVTGGYNGLHSYTGLHMPNSVWDEVHKLTIDNMERLAAKVRVLLIENIEFLKQVAEALEEKGTLLYSDIQRIKEAA